jgi:hypothetical protein
MEAVSEALFRNKSLWIAILVTLYAFSLYIYFYELPMRERFTDAQLIKSLSQIEG